MTNIFSSIGFFVGLFSTLGYFGIHKFNSLRVQNLSQDNLEFFLYLNVILSGLSIVLMSRGTRFFHNLSINTLKSVTSIYSGFAYIFIGWVGGLSFYYLIRLDSRNFFFCLLFTALFIVMLSPPLFWAKKIAKTGSYVYGFRIRNRKFLPAFKVMGICLISIGTWGIIQFFSLAQQ